MATMMLKDCIFCEGCDGEMFPFSFDAQNKRIGYRCIDCGKEAQLSFSDAERKGAGYEYFCLNDDGIASWQCEEHGYCERRIDELFGMDFGRFCVSGCIFDEEDDE